MISVCCNAPVCFPVIEEPATPRCHTCGNMCEAYELAPCPFCGYDKIKEPATRGFPVYAQCPKCNACGPERLTAPEAVKAWEARLDPLMQKVMDAAKQWHKTQDRDDAWKLRVAVGQYMGSWE